MNKIIPFVISIILSGIIAAQRPLHCGADEMRIATLKQNPEIAKAVIKRDAQLEKFTQSFIQNANFNAAKTNSTATYLIPVVFHVIHNYGSENISDAQLKDGLDIVNKTFRKQHPNNSSIVAAFQPIHADCDIEFRLATIDPNGNCTSGINRIASPLTSSGDHRVKNLIHWPDGRFAESFSSLKKIPGRHIIKYLKIPKSIARSKRCILYCASYLSRRSTFLAPVNK
jgi:hypothetical protein